MAVAFGAATEIAAGATASPTTGSHTPSGTPRGVEVTISHEAASDIITGVTYGGVAMTRVLRQEDNLGEFGTVYQYFLGSGIPTGTQTVSVSRTNNTTPIQVVVRTFTAAADTEIVDTVGANGSGAPTGTGNVANPSVILSYGGRTCIAAGVMWNGVNAPTSITNGTGLTRDADHDFGASSVVQHHQTTPGTADFTYGNTVATNSYALIASAISEVAVSSTRFYINIDATAEVTPARDAAWAGQISGPGHFQLNTNRAGTNRGTTTSLIPTTSVATLFVQAVSRPLDTAQTISGLLDMVWKCVEGGLTEDAYLAYSLRIVSPEGLERGLLARSMTTTGGVVEFNTTAETRIFSNVTLTSVDAQAGDRIVLELGVQGATPAGTQGVSIETGVDTNSDYALTSGLTSLGVGWLELDQIITFAGANDVFGFGAATKSLSASASGSGTNTPPSSGAATGSGAPALRLSASAAGTASQRFIGSGAPAKSLSASASGTASQRFIGSGAPAKSLSASASGTATNTPPPISGSGAVVTSLHATASGVASNPNSPVLNPRAVGGGGKRIRFEFVDDDEPEKPKKKRKKKKKQPRPEPVEAVSVEVEPVELPAFEPSQIDPALLLQLLRAASIPQPLQPPEPQPPHPMMQGSVEDRLLHHFLQVVGASALPEPDLTNAPHLLVRFLRMGH